MDTVKLVPVLFIVVNAVLALPFMVAADRAFRRDGRWSPALAVWSGVVMHGQFLATIALAFVDRESLFSQGRLTTGVGVIGVGAGVGVLAAGRWAYGSQKRVYGLLEDRVITKGIYRRSRNPQYIGYVAVFLGLALLSGSRLVVISTLLFAVLAHAFVTCVEEPHMKRSFGQRYVEYTDRVRRYL